MLEKLIAAMNIPLRLYQGLLENGVFRSRISGIRDICAKK